MLSDDIIEFEGESLNELLIHYVQGRPELWDLSSKLYKDNMKKKIAWAELAKELHQNGKYKNNQSHILEKIYFPLF